MTSSRVVRFVFSRPPFATVFSLCTVLFFAGATAAQAQLKVAVVDVNKVFTGYYKTKDADTTIRETREAAKKEYDRRLDDHHRLVEEIARLDKALADPALSDPAKTQQQKLRADKAQENQSVQQAMQEFKSTREKELQEQTIRIRTQIVEDIMVIVNARVERDHYDLILNKSAQGPGGKHVVLYANPDLDISDDIIAVLDKDHPSPASPTPSAPPASAGH